jgi:tetratricopeptide (TPR) repeat protein
LTVQYRFVKTVGRYLRTIRGALLIGVLPCAAALLAMASVAERARPEPASVPLQSSASSGPWTVASGTERSIAALQHQLRQRPHDLRSQTALGVAYLQRARETADPAYYTRAESLLQQAYAQASDDVDTLVGLGMLAHARHDFEAGLDWGRKAVEANPRKAAAYGVVGQAQLELGQYDDATATIQAMVDLLPNLASYGLVAYVRELHGDTLGAIDAMAMAVDAGVPGAESTEWSRVQLGHLHFGRGELVAAQAAYRRALALRPDYPPALGGLGRVAAARGDYDAAIAAYTQATAAAPSPELIIRLAEVYRAAGWTEEAARQEQLVRVQQQLSAAAGSTADVELALFELDHGGDAGAWAAWARAEWTRRPSIQVADALAWALYRAGECAEADAYSQAALRLGTRDALTHFRAGRVAECRGDADRAAALFREALAINPYFSVRFGPEAWQALQPLDARAGVIP